jgi:uncharacterized protein involved in outer membrane biogenesis
VLVVVAVVAVTLILIGVCLDRVVKSAIENNGPEMTETSVAVDTVHLSLLTGSARIKGLVLGNPNGYKRSQAMAVGIVAVGLDPATVFSDKVVLRSIRLESPQINFEGGLSGNNLGQILDNLNSTSRKSGPPATNAPPPLKEKFEVDDLTITGAKVQVALRGAQGQQEVLLPDIRVANLGTTGDGLTATELTCRILSAISSATMEVVAATAANLDKNAATLKQADTNTGKPAVTNAAGNLPGK